MSDLIRSHEGNADVNPNDPHKVHWGKYSMMGRFITSTTQCQAQCRASSDYNFMERPYIEELIMTQYKMNEEVSYPLVWDVWLLKTVYLDANIKNLSSRG